MRFRYSAVNFLQNPNKRLPIARPWGRGMGCILWFPTLIYTLLQLLQWREENHVILDRIITALNCTLVPIRNPFYKHGFTLIPVWVSNNMHHKVWGENYISIPKFQRAAVEVWGWINNFIRFFHGHVHTYPRWDLSYSMLIKLAPGHRLKYSDSFILSHVDGIFRCFFLHEKFCILVHISLKVVLVGLTGLMGLTFA